MDQSAPLAMMAEIGDARRPYDLLLRNNQGGSMVPITDAENQPSNSHILDQANTWRTTPIHFVPVDRSGQGVWRPGLQAPVLCQNMTYGSSDMFTESRSVEYNDTPPELPPRVSSVDATQSMEQQHSQFGIENNRMQEYGNVPNQAPIQNEASAQPMQENSENSIASMKLRMEGQSAPGFVLVQPYPSAEIVYNQQQGFMPQGSLSAPLRPIGPRVAGVLEYQNVAFFPSFFRRPVTNFYQPVVQPHPTIPNQIRFSTPQPAAPPSFQISSAPGALFRRPQNMVMFPQRMYPSYGYTAPPPPPHFSQFQEPAQVNAQVFDKVSIFEPTPVASGIDSLPGTAYQPIPAASTNRSSAIRRRGSRNSYKIVQKRASFLARPVGKTPSLHRSCEPVPAPIRYDNVETALAALNIGCSTQLSPLQPETPAGLMNADVGLDVHDGKSGQEVSGKTNDERPKATVSNSGKRPVRTFCQLCKNNKETEEFYTSHILKDHLWGHRGYSPLI